MDAPVDVEAVDDRSTVDGELIPVERGDVMAAIHFFSFFFLWTLWNNQFSSFDARRLSRSLVVLPGTAFVLKHMWLVFMRRTEVGSSGWRGRRRREFLS
jgi:hypothetical protein